VAGRTRKLRGGTEGQQQESSTRTGGVLLVDVDAVFGKSRARLELDARERPTLEANRAGVVVLAADDTFVHSPTLRPVPDVPQPEGKPAMSLVTLLVILGIICALLYIVRR
jgi:hypothetical protein